MKAPARVAALASALLLGRCAAGPGPQGNPAPRRGFLFESVVSGGTTFRYALYVPRAYDGAADWPLILFLHGRGESGTDGRKMVAHGLGPAIRRRREAWPFLVLLPQKPTEESEWESFEVAVMVMLERIRSRYRVDTSRIYLTGLSQGGHGAWVLGARHPGLWAAVVPVCGYAGSPLADLSAFHGSVEEIAGPLRSMPVWAFHGEADKVVPAIATETIARALREAGGAPRVTIYPGVGHNSWDRAYGEEELPGWLLSHRK